MSKDQPKSLRWVEVDRDTFVSIVATEGITMVAEVEFLLVKDDAPVSFVNAHCCQLSPSRGGLARLLKEGQDRQVGWLIQR